VIVQPKHLTAVRLRFAASLKAALKKNPVRPRQGYTQRAFAKKIDASPANISQWCTGRAIPRDEAILDRAIAALYGNKSDCEAERKQLREFWRAAHEETNQNQEEVRRSVVKLRGFLLPHGADRGVTRWAMENLVDLIGDGRVTYALTSQINMAIKLAPHRERTHISEALVKILAERVSSEADRRIKEIVAAVLSKDFAWRPTEFERKALLDMCQGELDASWAPLSIAAPISVALARAGYPDALKKTLSRHILDAEHGIDDLKRVENYYGNEFLLFHGLLKHFADRNRAGSAGLIWANDTNALLRLADSPTLPQNRRRAIRPKLLLSAKLLYEAGMEKEAERAATKANLIK
jgi:transcriptional regulator with XRE-family HTH domain